MYTNRSAKLPKWRQAFHCCRRQSKPSRTRTMHAHVSHRQRPRCVGRPESTELAGRFEDVRIDAEERVLVGRPRPGRVVLGLACGFDMWRSEVTVTHLCHGSAFPAQTGGLGRVKLM